LFEISGTPFGVGDQVNTVADPDEADDEIGPGTFVLRFQDVAGDPGGAALIHSYDMSLNFGVGGPVTVTTALETSAGPVECGVTPGTLTGTTVTWSPSVIQDLTQVGSILCMGGLCSTGGLPNGTPQLIDEVVDQPIDDFVFAADFSSFTMAETIIQSDDQSTTTWTYTGTEVSRELVSAPACQCE